MRNNESTEGRLANGLHNQISTAVQLAVNEAAQSPDQGGQAPGWLYITGMSALAAHLTACCVIGNRPILTPEEIATRGQQELQKLVTPERAMFAAIYSAVIFDDYDPTDGRLTTSTGLDKLVETMRLWKAVYPDKKPENYFDAKIIEAINRVDTEASRAFDGIMHKLGVKSGPHTVN